MSGKDDYIEAQIKDVQTQQNLSRESLARIDKEYTKHITEIKKDIEYIKKQQNDNTGQIKAHIEIIDKQSNAIQAVHDLAIAAGTSINDHKENHKTENKNEFENKKAWIPLWIAMALFGIDKIWLLIESAIKAIQNTGGP